VEKRVAVRTRKTKDDSAPAEEVESLRKCGFQLTPDTDFKLTVFARKKHKSRSTVIEELLVEKLRGVVISFRGNASEEGEAA